MKIRIASKKSFSTLFAAVTVVAYGLLLPVTGFYWDDWPFAWIARFLGPKEFFSSFVDSRPFLGPIFFVTTSLIPAVPLYWQIFALIIRFISGLSAWFALNQIWPQHKQQVLITSLLFLVFPGYSQHWVAFTHINQEWIPFIFYLLSFGFTARALRNNNRSASNTIYAILFLIAGLFPTEYFVGLEPLRFLFIWVIVSDEVEGFRQKFIQAVKRWWPYLLIWLGNAIWLIYFYTVGIYDSYDVEAIRKPLTILQILSDVGDAIWKGGLYVWAQVLVLTSKSISQPASILTLVLIAITFIFFLIYLRQFDQAPNETKTFARIAILAGLSGLLLGRLPSLAAGLPLTLQSSNDRFMISMMLGGSLFAVGIVDLLIRSPHIRNYVFALLIALGIGQQFFNANIFRRDWEKQQQIYWQLAWRIPAMKPNTLLITDQMPIDYETDISFTAPLNWMYAPDYKRTDLPYALVFTTIRLGGPTLPTLEKNVPVNRGLRTAYFDGSTSQAIVIYMPQHGCLRVLDPARGDQTTYNKQSHYLVDAIPLSDPSNILVDVNQTAQLPFLSEPQHTWCYFYAKAELAYQKRNWAQVIDLIDEATQHGYRPEDPFEWLGYIEAEASTGNIEAAKKLSMNVLTQDNSIRKGLCMIWERIQAEGPAGSGTNERANQILADFQCVH